MAPVVVCRNCECEGPFATVERILGSSHISVHVDGIGVPQYTHDGSTDVHWDSSETTAYECRNCGHEEPTFDKLVKVKRGEE